MYTHKYVAMYIRKCIYTHMHTYVCIHVLAAIHVTKSAKINHICPIYTFSFKEDNCFL